MIRKTLALSALLLSTIVLGAHPAAAGGGPSDYAECTVTVEPSSFRAGATVTVTGTGLEPNFTTTIEFNSVTEVVGTVTTDAAGEFVTDVVIPSDATGGPHTITAVCDTPGNISSTDVTVTVSSTAETPGAPLPRTGSDSTEPLVVAGGLALLAGIAFVLVARRRRQSHAGV